MDDYILTIEEVAKYLRVSEQTVEEWADKGEIPAGKFGENWRFKKQEIEKWADDKLVSKAASYTSQPIRMRNVLSQDRVMFLDFPRKREALSALAECLAQAPQIKNKQDLILEILRREDLMSTAIGRNIAIPHVRLSSVTDLVVAVGISKCDIQDFNAFDDAPVRLLFMIAAAYNQHTYYLQTLSYFSAKLKSNSLRNSILSAPDVQSAYELLIMQDSD